MIEMLQSFIVNILSMLVTLGILVTIHEYGHFWVARRCGVKIERFSIGFGKSLFSWTRGETEYRVAILPLGGYVKMYGEQKGEGNDVDRDRAFNHKPLYQRSLIVAAGPVANFLLAIVLYWVMFVSGVTGIAPVIGTVVNESPAALAGLMSGDEIIEVDSSPTKTWQEVQFQLLERLGETGTLSIKVLSTGSNLEKSAEININRWLSDTGEPDVLGSLGFSFDIPARLAEIEDGGRADIAGLQPNDLIIAVNGETIQGWSHWVSIIRANPEMDVLVTLQRNGLDEVMTLKPLARASDNGESIGYIGAGVQRPEKMAKEVKTRYSVLAAIPVAIEETWVNILFVFASIKKLIVGLISVENLMGPITIAQVAGQTVSYGLEYYISFLAVLSISLGVMNLLPIPVLDGGHLFFYMIEALIRRPVPEKIQAMGMQLGILLIAGVMLIAFYVDVNRFL